MAEANKKENFFARTGKRLSRWFREMRSELKKVVWPSKSQMVNNTLVVLATSWSASSSGFSTLWLAWW